MKAPLDSADFRFDRSGNLLERKALVLGQHKNLALQRRQSIDSLCDQCSRLLSSRIDRLDGRLFIPDGIPSALRTPALENQIPRNAEQEAAQRAALRVVSRCIAKQRQEAILGDFFGIVCVPRHAVAEAIDGVFVFPESGIELRSLHSLDSRGRPLLLGSITRNGRKGYGGRTEFPLDPWIRIVK